jgi:hypothetical protein
MHLRIAGQPVHPSDVAAFELSFGRNHSRSDLTPYELEIDKADLLARMTPAYDELVKGLKEDEEITGAFQPLYDGAVNYPSLSEVLQLPPAQIVQVIGTYLDYEFVSAYVTKEDAARDVRWLLLNIDGIEVSGDRVKITGKARHLWRRADRTLWWRMQVLLYGFTYPYECYDVICHWLADAVPDYWDRIRVDFEIIEMDTVSEVSMYYVSMRSTLGRKYFSIDDTRFAACFYALARSMSTPEKGLFRKCEFTLRDGGYYEADFEYESDLLEQQP